MHTQSNTKELDDKELQINLMNDIKNYYHNMCHIDINNKLLISYVNLIINGKNINDIKNDILLSLEYFVTNYYYNNIGNNVTYNILDDLKKITNFIEENKFALNNYELLRMIIDFGKTCKYNNFIRLDTLLNYQSIRIIVSKLVNFYYGEYLNYIFKNIELIDIIKDKCIEALINIYTNSNSKYLIPELDYNNAHENDLLCWKYDKLKYILKILSFNKKCTNNEDKNIFSNIVLNNYEDITFIQNKCNHKYEYVELYLIDKNKLDLNMLNIVPHNILRIYLYDNNYDQFIMYLDKELNKMDNHNDIKIIYRQQDVEYVNYDLLLYELENIKDDIHIHKHYINDDVFKFFICKCKHNDIKKLLNDKVLKIY